MDRTPAVTSSIVSPAGLCPDWDQWDQTKPVDNAREAMQQADDWLGIPQVEDMEAVHRLLMNTIVCRSA